MIGAIRAHIDTLEFSKIEAEMAFPISASLYFRHDYTFWNHFACLLRFFPVWRQ